MRTLSIVAALVIVFGAASPADAGWRGAEWGMTPDEVQTAMKGEAPLAQSRRDDMGDTRVKNIGEFEWKGRKLKSLYYYDEKGLALVVLDWKSNAKEKDCQALLEELIAGHGNPLRVDDQLLFKNIVWHDKPNANRVRLMVSLPAGICTLHMERLAEYEANDLANPGLQVNPPKRS